MKRENLAEERQPSRLAISAGLVNQGVLVVVGSAASAAMIGLIGAAHLPELVGGVWVFYFGHSLLTKR